MKKLLLLVATVSLALSPVMVSAMPKQDDGSSTGGWNGSNGPDPMPTVHCYMAPAAPGEVSTQVMTCVPDPAPKSLLEPEKTGGDPILGG